MNLFKLVEKNRDGRNTAKLCRLLGVSRSGYYAWKEREPSDRARHDDVLKVAICELHQGHKRAYGARRVHQALRQKGLECSVRRVTRLMKEAGIKASSRGLYTWTPGKHAFYSSTGNQLEHAGEPQQTGEQWAGDFTYIKTSKGWLYHAIVLDLYSREVVGWAFSRRRDSELTKSALNMALSQHRPKPGCVFHSDQGIEYAAHEYGELVKAAGMTRSMSRKGTPLDNAVVESFFHSLKTELIHQVNFDDAIEATARTLSYIEFYNRERLHSSLGYRAPMEYGKLAA